MSIPFSWRERDICSQYYGEKERGKFDNIVASVSLCNIRETNEDNLIYVNMRLILL